MRRLDLDSMDQSNRGLVVAGRDGMGQFIQQLPLAVWSVILAVSHTLASYVVHAPIHACLSACLAHVGVWIVHHQST
jgi:hypothetical protein